MNPNDNRHLLPGSRFPVLCGIKHCGKSSCGKRLAEKTDTAFIDLDIVIETLYKERTGAAASCREIYTANGASFFRSLETAAAASVCKKRHLTLAAGGGLCDNNEAWQTLKTGGAFFIFLDEPQQRLFERITADGIPPFLQNGKPETVFAQLYERRRAFYLTHCDARLPITQTELSVEQRVEQLLNILKQEHFLNGEKR